MSNSNMEKFNEETVKKTILTNSREIIIQSVETELRNKSYDYMATNIRAYAMNCDYLANKELKEVMADTKHYYNPAKKAYKWVGKIDNVEKNIKKVYDAAKDMAILIKNIDNLSNIYEPGSDDYNAELVNAACKIFNIAKRTPLEELYKSQLELGQAILLDGADIINDHVGKLNNSKALLEAIQNGNWEEYERLTGLSELNDLDADIKAFQDWCNMISAEFGISNPFYDPAFQDMLTDFYDKRDRFREACEDIWNNPPVGDEAATGNAKEANSKTGKASNTKRDPLIIDLDGDGFNVKKKELGANFDLDKNGFAEKINWTSRDGFLCLDLNGNGTIDDGGELFGDQTLLADGTRAKNGFEALAQYDSNGDGVIDAGDEIFDSLRIWVDADNSGTNGESEMKTLAELGITSINLGFENVNAETDTEATIGNAATFTREDGTTGGIGELWVSVDLFDTVDNVSVEVPDDIKELPNVRSIGNVYSLHNAMALDETGELKALVESFVSEEDADKRMEIAEQILFFICGAWAEAAMQPTEEYSSIISQMWVKTA